MENEKNDKKGEVIFVDPQVVKKIIRAKREVLKALAHR
jgi:hypothetical protein